MALNSTAMSNILNNTGGTEPEIPQLTVNTADFNDQDLQDYVDISEEIERSTQERHSQRKCSISRSNTIKATLKRIEIFESNTIDDDHTVKNLQSDTAYETEKDRGDVIKNTGKFLVYLSEDNVKKQLIFKSSSHCLSDKNVTGDKKVSADEVSWPSKCDIKTYPLLEKETPAKVVKATNIRELRKKYESSVETETTASPSKAKQFVKTSKLKRKTKVYHNKIDPMARSSSPTPHTLERKTPNFDSSSSPTYTSTPKPKSFPAYKTKLQMPKSSPLLDRKSQMSKTSSSSSISDSSPATNKPLQQQHQQRKPNTAHLVVEKLFSQLTAKDKTLLYRKFIEDMIKLNPKFSKYVGVIESNIKKEIIVPNGEVVIEKQNSVKQLRTILEAKLMINNPIKMDRELLKKPSLKSSLGSR